MAIRPSPVRVRGGARRHARRGGSAGHGRGPRGRYLDRGDRYYRVVFDRTISAFHDADWRADCPDSHPYLDRNAGVPGMHMGQGVEMVRSSWKIDARYTGREIWPEGTASAIWGTARNWLDGDSAIRLTMVCTGNLANAWWP